MAITVECECGKQLQAPDRLAGKRAKCPACGRELSIPVPAAAAPTDATSKPAQQGPTKPCPGCGQAMPLQSIACPHCGQIARAGIRPPVAASEESDKLRFSFLGIDVTWGKAIIAVVVVVVVTVAVLVYRNSLGRDAHVVQAVRVRTVQALSRLDARETDTPFGVDKGFSVGMKDTSPQESGPGGQETAGQGDLVYSVGRQDELFVTKPDPAGQFVLVELEVSQRLLKSVGQSGGYKLVFEQDKYKVSPAGDGGSVQPQLLFADLGEAVVLALADAKCNVHDPLLPPGRKPDSLELVEAHGGVTQGKATYNGKAGVLGHVEFASHYYQSRRTPGVTGLTAKGKLYLDDDLGIKVDYKYRGPDMKVSWNESAAGWWVKPKFTKQATMSPFSKFRLGLLFKGQPGTRKYSISLAGKKIATFKLAAVARKSDPASKRTAPTKAKGYFDLLVAARHKARGVDSMSNMKQLGIAIMMYTEQHDGQLPDRLEQLRTTIGAFDQLMLNKRTGQNPGYIYEKPPPGAAPATTAILFEARGTNPDPTGSVLYLDGHIEPGR